MTPPLKPFRRAPAQNLVEYGLIVGVVVLAFVFGLNGLIGAEGTYLASSQTKPDPTAIVGALPKHAVGMQATCNPGPSPVYTGQPFPCVLSINDLYTLGPTQVPQGVVTFTGTGNFSACNLVASSTSSSMCGFTFTPTSTRGQSMTADFAPTSNHLTQQWNLGPPVIYALDRTHIDVFTCASSAPLGEPARCTASVLDEFTLQHLDGIPITLTTTASPQGDTGTFSPWGSMPASLSPFNCTTAGGLCRALFRSASSSKGQGAYAISATFARDLDHEASPPLSPQAILVNGPSAHTATVSVTCPTGSIRTSPLFINGSPGTSICTVTVTDTNPPVGGDPTNVIPSGQVSWLPAPPNNGSAGGFSPTPCILAPLTAQAASCLTTYQPTMLATPDGADLANTHHIQSTFSGNPSIYLLSSGSLTGAANVFVRDVHQVSVFFTCSTGTSIAAPLVISNGDKTTCTVTVTDLAPNPATPTGNVSWTVTGNSPSPGTYSPVSCVLVAVDTSNAECQTDYTPTSVSVPFGPGMTNQHHLRAAYLGDWLHQPPGSPAGPLDVYVKN